METSIKRSDIIQEIENRTFLEKYWDARVFGNTFLEEGREYNVQTGVAQFGLAVSISPIRIERMTTTKVAPVEEEKNKGMAPLGFSSRATRHLLHAVFCECHSRGENAMLKAGY